METLRNCSQGSLCLRAWLQNYSQTQYMITKTYVRETLSGLEYSIRMRVAVRTYTGCVSGNKPLMLGRDHIGNEDASLTHL